MSILVYGLERCVGGIGRYTIGLARALAALEEEVEVTLFTAGGPGPLVEAYALRHVPLPGCRLLPGLMTLGNAWIPLRTRQLDLDLVHDPTGVTPFLFGAGDAATVVTVHDVFAWSYPGVSTWLDTLIYRHWLPRVLPRRADAVITDSHASREDIARYLRVPAPAIHVVPLGVDSGYHALPGAQVTRVLSRGGLPERYLLFVGSVEKRKNLAGLLHAYAQLHDLGQTIPLIVVGAQRLQSPGIRDLVKELGLEERVIFTGYVPDADLPALYSGADLFVFPSLYEGFGLPPLEAMACGTPVICSNAASLPEVVGDAALTVDPTDVEGLAGAMHRVLSEPDLAADLRARGLERARQFTWERTARETVAVYRQVLGEGARG